MTFSRWAPLHRKGKASPSLSSRNLKVPDPSVLPGQRLQCLALLSRLLPRPTENIMPPSPASVLLIQTVYRHGEQSSAFIQTPKHRYYMSLSSSVGSDLKVVCFNMYRPSQIMVPVMRTEIIRWGRDVLWSAFGRDFLLTLRWSVLIGFKGSVLCNVI